MHPLQFFHLHKEVGRKFYVETFTLAILDNAALALKQAFAVRDMSLGQNEMLFQTADASRRP